MATTSGRRHLLRRGFLDLELHGETTVGNGSGKPHGERSLRIPRDLLLAPSSCVAKTQMRKIGQKYKPDKVELRTIDQNSNLEEKMDDDRNWWLNEFPERFSEDLSSICDFLIHATRPGEIEFAFDFGKGVHKNIIRSTTYYTPRAGARFGQTTENNMNEIG
ncbi:MAG: hypothetical protein AAF998_05790 [Bacteroidota bacterium]